MNLLSVREDAEECVNETYYQAWEQMPPQRPDKLKPWLGRIVRNISIKLWHKNHAQKRYHSFTVALNELEDSIPSSQNVERTLEDDELSEAINRWLLSLPQEDRVLFVRRYWHGMALNVLAEEWKVPPKKLAQKMYRLRLALKSFLEKEAMM